MNALAVLVSGFSLLFFFFPPTFRVRKDAQISLRFHLATLSLEHSLQLYILPWLGELSIDYTNAFI